MTAIVLAAGEGTRMRSDLAKVLHVVGGRPLLAHVLAALERLRLGRCVVVVGKHRDRIEDAVRSSGLADGVDYAVQEPPRGTGDAVRVGLASVGRVPSTLLVVPGDAPLLLPETLETLLHVHAESGSGATLLTARMSDPTGYGRVLRSAAGDVTAIVEDTDAGYEDREIDEVNAGVYVFDGEALSDILHRLQNDNAQQEYYITDAIGLLRGKGHKVTGYRTHPEEIMGVNSRGQLARVGEMLALRTCERWMDEGVTIVDPSTTYIDPSVTIGRDATIRPFTFLEGNTIIGAGAEIGPQTRIVDSEIEDEAIVTFAVVVSSSVGPQASVGPYASLRPGTRLERGAKIGTFVESKKTVIGEGSRANHLAYLGDAEIGRRVNVGAGTITCNYDGRNKHQTVIEDDAYIGSDTMLVAPTRIGKRAATGAGSVVRGDVPEDALAVGVPARILQGKGNKMASGSPEPDPEDEAGRAAGDAQGNAPQ